MRWLSRCRGWWHERTMEKNEQLYRAAHQRQPGEQDQRKQVRGMDAR